LQTLYSGTGFKSYASSVMLGISQIFINLLELFLPHVKSSSYLLYSPKIKIQATDIHRNMHYLQN
jgi:hypothetical protein